MPDHRFRIDICKRKDTSEVHGPLLCVDIEKDGRLLQRQGYLSEGECHNAFLYMISRYTEMECKLFVEGLPADNLVPG